jgi:hypothetical protein
MLCTKCKTNIKLSEATYVHQTAKELHFYHVQCVPPRTTAKRLPPVGVPDYGHPRNLSDAGYKEQDAD